MLSGFFAPKLRPETRSKWGIEEEEEEAEEEVEEGAGERKQRSASGRTGWPRQRESSTTNRPLSSVASAPGEMVK